MMPRDFRILSFSDLNPDISAQLDDLLQRGRTNPLLGVFLHRVGVALRHEISTQSRFERKGVPNFSTIDDLVKKVAATNLLHDGIRCALLTISQIIQYFEYELSSLSRLLLIGNRYDDCALLHQTAKADTCVVGSGVGLLAAAAVASSPSLSSLVPIAVEVVLISYRTGSSVGAVASRLHLESSSDNCWAHLVTGLSDDNIREILSAFHREKVSLFPPQTRLIAKHDLSENTEVKGGLYQFHRSHFRNNQRSTINPQVDFQGLIIGNGNSSALY